MVYGKLRPLYVDGYVLLDRSFLLTIFVFLIFFHLLFRFQFDENPILSELLFRFQFDRYII
ncbi:hypothetical protein HanRHA438_Chr09g0426111 [Helianthus annuus]|uniref:Uncharacterized protein n=1 Tax=Helianthus annuus TaxID=4232 RepID=A0A251UCN7_HELAN|nr:hypothetical protein HanXRQr2_Chr09g0413811 [Helianthus annuus]KAJ0527977.1 hypothetical protein HanHA300_Chr09g0340121 [Helianthus annuus]KAJ0536816.1 hypothetical protein HanIR_Chr09g0445891 [Helianthus annuus]KAJ0544410.1 hypothetical protein HanHA89_Chr09g0361391 [Helianthus annuus]KAJ0709413.1 hypothetical protein HanLR1_Chr09g0340131 [Helianthus annuus]